MLTSITFCNRRVHPMTRLLPPFPPNTWSLQVPSQPAWLATGVAARPRRMLKELWAVDRPLTSTGIAMLVLLVFATVGIAVDDREITGAPAWLKPAKFAASIALYAFTLAWIFGSLEAWPRTRRIVGRLTATVLTG